MSEPTERERLMTRFTAMGPAAVILLTVFVGVYFYATQALELAHVEHMRCLDAALPIGRE